MSRPLLVVAALIVAVGGVYVLFGEDIESAVMVVLFGEPPAPVAVKPAGPARTKVAAVPAPPGESTNPAPPQPGAPAPSAAQAPAASTPAAATPATPTPVAPATIAASTPLSGAAEPAPGASSATAEPPPPQPAPAPVAVTTAEATAAPAASSAAVTPAPSAQPIEPQVQPQPSKIAPVVTAEQDLPTVLDRIRQQRTKASLQPDAVVDRSSTGATTKAKSAASAVQNMVSVATTPAQERDDTERAYDMLLHGQYEGALELYSGVLRVNPNSIAASLGKAIALHKLRRLAEARPIYQHVLSIDPNNREALTNLMSIIASQSPAAALSELRDLQKTYPAFSPIAAEIGQIEAQSGNIGDAIASFNRAIALSPDNGLYRLNLAIIQDRAGMRKEAGQSYEAALSRLNADAQLPVPIEAIRARLRYLQSR